MASQLPFKSLNELVKIQLDTLAANSPVPLNTPIGAMLTAIAYAVALVALVLQRSLQVLLRIARLTTATGDDVDSYVADFGFTRLPGVTASGIVTFGKFSAAVSSIPVPVGSTVATSDSTPVEFTVVADLENAAYDVASQSYTLLTGNLSVDVSVVCKLAGTIGNVIASSINKISTSLPGIDNVTNTNSLSNGVDEETDDQVKSRFILYIQSLSKATLTAIAAAISNVQQGLISIILENKDNTGATVNGLLTIVIDDGSGVSKLDVLASVDAAVDAVRPAGVRKATQWATVKNLLVGARIQYDPILVVNVISLQTALKSALLSYINSLGVGKAAQFNRFSKAIWNTVSPGDPVTTTIASTPASSTSSLYLTDTTSIAVGQLIQVTGFFTLDGTNPIVQSIENNRINLGKPLTAIPPSDTVVTTFTVLPEQVISIENLTISAVAAATTLASGSTSTVLKVTSGTGIAAGQLIFVEGYVPNPAIDYGFLPNVTVVAGTDITINPALGIIQADGTWAATPTPPAGAKVYTATAVFNGAVNAAAGGKLDLTASLVEVIRSSIDRILIAPFYV